MPEPVRTSDPDGIDFGRIMQLTFVTTIVVGAPIVAILSIPFSLPTWSDRAMFAVRVGALVWFVTAIVVYFHERKRVATNDTTAETATGTESRRTEGADETDEKDLGEAASMVAAERGQDSSGDR